MRALTWQGREDVTVTDVPDPVLREASDAVVRITSTAICGSDLHLFSILGPFIDPGDVLGHEPMGVVEEVGSEVTRLKVGDRVVVPFADVGPVVVPDDGEPDERYLFLSDVVPTAWQAVEYAQVPAEGSVAVIGLGPIGQMSARIARHRGAETVIGVDLVPERLAMAARHGVVPIDLREVDDLRAAVLELTDGRGADSVIDAVGMEAHGSPLAKGMQVGVGVLPDALARPLFTSAGVDRLAALNSAIDVVRRGGTISLSGVYGGMKDPLPMLELFDKQVTIRMGQANVHHWIPDTLPLVSDPADPLGVLDLRTHRLPLEDAPHGYEIFQKKDDGAIKVVLDPSLPRAKDAP